MAKFRLAAKPRRYAAMICKSPSLLVEACRLTDDGWIRFAGPLCLTLGNDGYDRQMGVERRGGGDGMSFVERMGMGRGWEGLVLLRHMHAE